MSLFDLLILVFFLSHKQPETYKSRPPAFSIVAHSYRYCKQRKWLWFRNTLRIFSMELLPSSASSIVQREDNWLLGQSLVGFYLGRFTPPGDITHQQSWSLTDSFHKADASTVIVLQSHKGYWACFFLLPWCEVCTDWKSEKGIILACPKLPVKLFTKASRQMIPALVSDRTTNFLNYCHW